MKKVTYVTLWGAYLFSKVHICDAKIAYLDDIANLEILPYGLHFSDVMSFTKIIKDVDGLYILLAVTGKWCHYQSTGILQNPCKINLIEE